MFKTVLVGKEIHQGMGQINFDAPPPPLIVFLEESSFIPGALLFVPSDRMVITNIRDTRVGVFDVCFPRMSLYAGFNHSIAFCGQKNR